MVFKQNNFESYIKNNDFTFNNKLTVRLRLINRFQNSQKIINTMIRNNNNNKKYQNEVIFNMQNNDKIKIEKQEQMLNFPIVEFVFDEQLLVQCRNKCSLPEVNLKQGRRRFVTRKEYEIKEPLSPTSSTSSSSAAIDTQSASTSSLDEMKYEVKSPSKTINLISNESKPEMQILKLTRAVDQNQDEHTARRDNENYDRLNGWNRRSKLGCENEKELQFIFQRMYYRYKSSLPPSPKSKTMPVTKSNNTAAIETYRKNGRLCSNC